MISILSAVLDVKSVDDTTIAKVLGQAAPAT